MMRLHLGKLPSFSIAHKNATHSGVYSSATSTNRSERPTETIAPRGDSRDCLPQFVPIDGNQFRTCGPMFSSNHRTWWVANKEVLPVRGTRIWPAIDVQINPRHMELAANAACTVSESPALRGTNSAIAPATGAACPLAWRISIENA